MDSINLSYWLPPNDERKCKSCHKKLARRARRTSKGFCRECRLKHLPPALGKKRSDKIGKMPVFYGKDNCFSHIKFVGEDHWKWMGNNVGYSALHAWLKRKLGHPKECVKCGSNNNLQWASISHKAKRDLEDYFSLCSKCHCHYDKGVYYGY